jgi:hypothetical protein
MTSRINARVAPLLAIALAAGLAACGAGAGAHPGQEAAGSGPDAPAGGAAAPQAAAAPAGTSCAALAAAALVPFDASGRALAFTFDRPEGWGVETSAEGEEAIAMFTGRSLTEGSTGHEIQFQLVQFNEDRTPNLDVLRRMGHAEVATIPYGGQAVTVMGQRVFDVLMYQMYLPVTKADGSRGHVQVTFQISPASDRCPEEREAIFKAVLQTFRPNPGTSLKL